MDGVYATQRHIYDVTRKYYLLGRDYAIKELDLAHGESLLEIGCGTGRNLILAAKKYPRAKLYGIDISSEMLLTAQKNINKAGLSHRIKLAQGDAASFDPEELFEKDRFDRVLMSYTLSMIPPWEAAIWQGLEVLSPQGKLIFVDFWDQSGLPQWSRVLLRKWLELFHVAPREGLDMTAKTIAEEAGRQSRFTPIYRGYACLGTIG